MSDLRYPIVLRRIEREQVTLATLAASVEVHPTLVEGFVEGTKIAIQWLL